LGLLFSLSVKFGRVSSRQEKQPGNRGKFFAARARTAARPTGKMALYGDVGMNFDLTEDQRKLQATVADFAQSEVAPVAEALDRDASSQQNC
jgi:hypothetical protein